MESNVSYYIALLVLIILGVFAAKKMVSCLMKTVVCLVLLAAMAFIYWNYLR